jgi:hypothetical protein
VNVAARSRFLPLFVCAAILGVALLIAAPVHAGTIVVTVTTASGVCSGGCTKTYTDTDANLAKIIPAYQQSCNTAINGTCTNLQVMQAWANWLVAQTVAFVTNYDKNNLQSAAVSGYTPINPQ